MIPASGDRAVFVSALDRESLAPLLRAIEKALSARVCTLDLLVPYADGSVLHLLREQGQILSQEYTEKGIRVKASVNRQYEKSLREYLCE